MSLNLEQIKTLDAIARYGSVARAAESLHKVHSAVIYTMKSIEEQIELKLFDRTGYRTKLTLEGQRIWQESQKYLEAERDMVGLLQSLQQGWEPYLRLVFDGVLPLQPIMKTLKNIESKKAPVKLYFYSEYLSRVEESFERENADIMISVLPPVGKHLEVEKLSPLKLLLVAHQDHPLTQSRRSHSLQELEQYLFITVRGSDFRLQLSTSRLDESSQLHMSDFSSKKEAILAKMGYGWMPQHLIEKEIDKKVLVPVRWEGKSLQQLQIYLAHRGLNRLGRAGKTLVEDLGHQDWLFS